MERGTVRLARGVMVVVISGSHGIFIRWRYLLVVCSGEGSMEKLQSCFASHEGLWDFRKGTEALPDPSPPSVRLSVRPYEDHFSIVSRCISSPRLCLCSSRVL